MSTLTCDLQRPENNYYFPDLHHMKHEAEDCAGPNGRNLRFGFDPLVFPEFSWRGYALMTSAQEVKAQDQLQRTNDILHKLLTASVPSSTSSVDIFIIHKIMADVLFFSVTCVSLTHETPPTALILDARSGGPLPALPQEPSPPADGVTLKAPQNQVTLRGFIPHLGQHVFVIHFYQTEHPTFPTEVFVDGGRPRSTCLALSPGSFLASFCPHLLGCQNQVISSGQVEFDISEAEVAVTVKVPEGKSLTLVCSA
ncbi:hypothetical protein LEMLEM_LOCUS7216 [Lemmus lemmus]